MHELDIPEFLKISAERRKEAWRLFKPRQAAPDHYERWREREAARKAEQEEKTRARINALRASRGLDPYYNSGLTKVK